MSETRVRLVAALADRLTPLLSDDRLGEGVGYTPDQVRAIAETMADLDVDRSRPGLEPREALLLTMLRAQPGIGEAEAIVLARALLRVELGSLLVAAGLAAEILDIHQTTLLRRRWEGDIAAALIDTGTYRAGAYYRLADLLYVLAYQSKVPFPGGHARNWPPLP